jgi:hypothetical protein
MIHLTHTPADGSFFWTVFHKNKNGNSKNHRFSRFSRFCFFKTLIFNGLLFIVIFSFLSFLSLLIQGKRDITRWNEVKKTAQTAENQPKTIKTRETRKKLHFFQRTTLIQVAAINTNPTTFAR